MPYEYTAFWLGGLLLGGIATVVASVAGYFAPIPRPASAQLSIICLIIGPALGVGVAGMLGRPRWNASEVAIWLSPALVAWFGHYLWLERQGGARGGRLGVHRLLVPVIWLMLAQIAAHRLAEAGSRANWPGWYGSDSGR